MLDELLKRGAQPQDALQAGQALLSPAEAESIARRLRSFPLEEVGTPAWFAQHDQLERLNLQAHHNAQTRSEEYVKEALVSHGTLGVLVEELLATEAWRERLLPLLRGHLATVVDSVASWQLLYHEAAVANLLEVVLFHADACEAASEDVVLELADWCARRIAYLAADSHAHAKFKERSAQELMAQTSEEELAEREAETAFGAANCALALLRYLTDHSPRLSLGVLTRIASTNDTVMALLPLLEQPPWLRRGRGGQQERYVGGQWRAVDPSDQLAVPQQEAQVWLALNNLLVDPTARAKLDLTPARCDALFKLKKRFSELLFDQLPVLRDLQRVIDELACGINAAPAELAPSKLIVEQVPALRARLLARSDWAALAAAAKRQQFGPAAAALSRQRLESMLAGLDFLCGMEEGAGAAGGGTRGAGGPLTTAKLDAYRRVKEGVWEWWATYSLDINTDRPPERVTAGAAAGAGGGDGGRAADENKQPTSGGTGDGSAKGVAGLRYRLRPLSEGLHRALPGEGKVVLLYGGRSCEALVRLPTCETRDASGLAPAVWLTVGGLAGPGLALQLKLKRLDRPSERDKEAGVWFPYVPVGGGLTVREGLLREAAA